MNHGLIDAAILVCPLIQKPLIIYLWGRMPGGESTCGQMMCSHPKTISSLLIFTGGH